MKSAPLFLVSLTLIFASCRSNKSGSSGSNVGTPDHNMSAADYPFDEAGNYREDWVKAGGRTDDGRNVVDLTANNPPPYTYEGASRPEEDRPKVTKTSSGSSGSKPKKTSSSSSKPKKPAAKYTTITVKKGDTLYGLARKYGTSVKAIQNVNGMGGSTVLRDGRSLKIPR